MTSFVRVLGLDPVFYHALLRMFHSSWMRTMNISRTPSEWVVQHVLRKTFPELLSDAAHIPDWAKFILQRMDRMRIRRAA